MGRHYCFTIVQCVCGQHVSVCGRARYSHMMAHVRRGDAIMRRLRAPGRSPTFKWVTLNPKPIKGRV